MEQNNKKVAIIMINYKTYVERFLQEALASLNKVDYPKDKYKLYVVDNATSPESRALIQNFLEQVPAINSQIIANEKNSGMYGNHIGYQQAKLDGYADYLCFWNLDAYYDPQIITEAIKVLDQDNNIGLVQAKIRLYPEQEEEWQKPLLNTRGNLIHYLGFAFTDGYREPDNEPDEVRDITCASGAAMFLRGEVYEKVGGYDEKYFMYHDDVEFSIKIRLAGYRVVIAPRSIFWHKAEFGRSVMQIYYMERNRLLFIFQFYKWFTLFLIAPMLLVLECGMLLYSIKNKWFREKLKVYRYFLSPKNWAVILKDRKEIKSRRKLSDRAMMKDFRGKVEFQEIDNVVLAYIGNPIMNLYWNIIKNIIIW